MKVTQKMLHKDLQPYFNRFNLVPYITGPRWATVLINKLLNRTKGKNIEGLLCDELFVPSSDGDSNIRVRVYRPKESSGKLPVLLYIHGGGYITGNPEMAADSIEKFIQTRPCMVVAPDYRKAYTKPFPAGFNDCYDTLLWIKNNASQMGALAEKIMVAGHSAGGGLTAAVTLKARDTGDIDIAFQMPIYPMIDDLQPSDPARSMRSPVWDTTINRIAWSAYLADLHKTDADIPPYAAPGRSSDYQGLPPTITFVGTLEPFYWETLEYVEGLRSANVEVSFKEYDGCFHGFDTLAPEAGVSQDALDFTFSGFAEFYDKYLESQMK